MEDLRLQYGPLWVDPAGQVSLSRLVRFVRRNGWSCGCWHWTPEAAARCLGRRLRRSESGIGTEDPGRALGPHPPLR